MEILRPDDWKDYALIDSGHGEKLERFGKYTLIRPEPQAIWTPALSEEAWKKLAHARFDRAQKDRFRFTDDVNGGWQKGNLPDNWIINYSSIKFEIKLRLSLTSFGHVGVFPEQASNWNFIFDTLQHFPVKQPRMLNLFAYTGAASLVARLAGAQVTHVDASRPGLNWANQNMELNALDNIRWVYEDALKFVKREVKRGNQYHAIIMDPPPYGRGPEGEKWILVEKLDELVQLSRQLLFPESAFFILSMYAVGLSPRVGLNIVQNHFPGFQPAAGEFEIPSLRGVPMPMGTFVRMKLF
jgi:23S rRNA (cytosine1962-C5)-methyltransferase